MIPPLWEAVEIHSVAVHQTLQSRSEDERTMATSLIECSNKELFLLSLRTPLEARLFREKVLALPPVTVRAID